MKEVILNGDKSLTHRAIILASLAKGTSCVQNPLYSEDTLNTLKIFEALGIKAQYKENQIIIDSPGMEAFHNQTAVVEAGNSGTCARLLLGLFAGIKDCEITIKGDDSLSKRPMQRITAILSRMGARFSRLDYLPITVYGTHLQKIQHQEELGSAQVKSSLLLAGLASNEEVEIEELKPSRNHTENFFKYLELPIDAKNNVINLVPPYNVPCKDYFIWNDISSSAFFIILALLIPNKTIKISNVLLNPFRDGFISILKQMGADIAIINQKEKCGELGGDLIIKYSHLKNIHINDPNIIPKIIDEIPILAIAALFAEGTFTLSHAEELRYKESDRIHSICANLKKMGVHLEEKKDGFSFEGMYQNFDKIHSCEVSSFSDHRIIMSFEVANQILKHFHKNSKTNILDIQNKHWIDTSFPLFYQILNDILS